MQGLQGPRIALLIDFDNVILGVEEPPGFDIELVVNALRSRGTVVLGRAYGDWYRHHRHRRKLMDHGIELVETPAFGPIIKNSADIRIALDAFEIGMTQHHINEFCLVSGDSDFLPLIKRLQYLGKTVTVIAGIKFTSELVRRNCNEFISYENLLAESVGASEDATVLEGAFALLVRTINTLHERGMEVRSSTVKQMMIQLNPVFSERNFGCNQFKQFLDKGCRAGMIKLGRRDLNSGEYNVLLLTDFEDETIEVEAVAPEPEKSARPPRRGRGRRGALTGEDQNGTAPTADGEVSSATSDEGIPSLVDSGDATAREISAREALRQGRLRSSGRTWKGGAANRSVLQGAVNGANASPEAEASPTENTEVANEPEAPPTNEATIEELVVADGGAVAEPEAETPEAEVAEEKPKRAPRRRRKPAAKKGEEAEAGAETDAVAAEAPAPETPVEPTLELPLEAAAGEENPDEEKKAAKKPVRRRAPRKKKEE